MSAKNIETAGDYHWRNSMRPARFFNFDARVVIFLMFFFLHIRFWTFFTALLFMAFFWVLERKGLTFSAAIRSVRCWILGDKRPAWIWTRKRKIVDYG